MNQNELKRTVAKAALAHVPNGGIIGVGTGSTANFFIEELKTIKHRVDGAVASSEATAKLLKKAGITVLDLNFVADLPVYVDGMDEVTRHGHMIKGGGGALTREKIVAAVAKKFVCVGDSSKLVGMLGQFPLPLEIIPVARSYVAREMAKLGGKPVLRENFITDNGNIILDIHGLEILNPIEMEVAINQISGVVTSGLFAKRGADIVLLASPEGIKTF